MLRELSEKQKNGLPAFFKGGTALYKSIRTTNRFSEDIDLSVDTHDCNRTQSAKRLEYAAKNTMYWIVTLPQGEQTGPK